jgi:hypothetical protein
MFIAAGQDVANVAESSASIVYPELTPRATFSEHFAVATSSAPQARSSALRV